MTKEELQAQHDAEVLRLAELMAGLSYFLDKYPGTITITDGKATANPLPLIQSLQKAMDFIG